MGGKFSQIPTTPSDFPYFSITFRRFDKIKIINSQDPNVINAVREAVYTKWPGGMQHEENEHGVFSFKLNGNPFGKGNPFGRTPSDLDDESARRLCCAILSNLRQLGWQLILSSDLSRIHYLTTWFFQRNNAVIEVDYRQCIRPDRLKEAQKTGEGSYCVRIRGLPWNNYDFDESTEARRILLNMFTQFERLRYSYIGSVNIKGTADSFFFLYDPNKTEQTLEFGCVSLNCHDRMRLIRMPSAVDVARQCIVQNWPRGLAKESANKNKQTDVHEFKFNGNPWLAHSDDAVLSRVVINSLMQALLASGWAIHAAIDLCRDANDKEAIIGGGHKWKLKGKPWHPNALAGNDYAMARNLLAVLMNQLAGLGWRAVCSADVCSETGGGGDAGTTADDGGEDGPVNTKTEEFPLDVHSIIFVQTGVPSVDAGKAVSDQGFGMGPSAPPSTSATLDPDPPPYDQVMK